MTLLDQINKLVPEPLKAQIKELALKFNAATAPVVPAVPANPAPTNLAAIETKLKDGTTLSVDKMEVGGKAMLISDAGSVDAPDASYEAEDGTIIVVANGLITAITPVSAPPAADPNGMPAMMAALTARMTAMETELSASKAEKLLLKTQLSDLTGSSKVAFEALNLILSAPAGDPIEHKVKRDLKDVPYDQMTNAQKTRYNKENK